MTFNTCFPFNRLKSLSPSVNNLFRGIPFSYEDKIHEDIQESLLLGRGAKGNFALCFHFIFAGFRKGLSAESLLFRQEEMAD